MKYVTAAQMRQIDTEATARYGIPSLILMENAGRSCAEEMISYLKTRGGKRVAIFCGLGNNGGDGLVLARHLFNHGLRPSIFYFQSPSHMKPDAMTNFKIIKKMRLDLVNCSVRTPRHKIQSSLESSDLIVDALFGTGLSRTVEEPFRSVIALLNQPAKPVFSIDIPSGLHADTGQPLGIAVKAAKTLTLGFPKKGFLDKKSRRYTGKVLVMDISLPFHG